MATLDWNKLILTPPFPNIIFSFGEETLFSQVPNLTRHEQKTQKANWNLANSSQKQFYVLSNTNQIKLYTYPDLLKENPLLRKFLNSE